MTFYAYCKFSSFFVKYWTSPCSTWEYFFWTVLPTSCSKSNTERYFLSQSQWCVRTGFFSSMIFPSTKHQIAMAASSTWQAQVPHHPTAVLLVHPALDRTVRTWPNHQHLSQHFLGWDCGQEENPKPGAEYSRFTCLLSVVSSGAVYVPYYSASSLIR